MEIFQNFREVSLFGIFFATLMEVITFGTIVYYQRTIVNGHNLTLFLVNYVHTFPAVHIFINTKNMFYIN